jgi:hypothetical protein
MSFTTIEQAHRQAAEREEKRNPLASKMSLRDHFAAKAMLIYFGPDAKVIKNDPDSIARWCYIMADSMLKAREA